MSGARTRRAKRLARIFPLVQELAGHEKEINGIFWARHDSREHWFQAPIPISVNARGGSALAESNFRVAERLIDEASTLGGTSYRWDAWPGGQIQTLVIRLDDAGALRMAQGIIYSLSDYPVLDDEDHSELEWEQNHPREGECYGEDCCTKCPDCDMVIPEGVDPDAIDECHSYNCGKHPENQDI